MFYNIGMDTLNKLSHINQYMAFEDDDGPIPLSLKSPPGSTCLVRNRTSQESNNFDAPFPVYMAALPGNRHVPLLKTVLTSFCEHNCFYCAFRSGRDFPRQSFNPEELAKIFQKFYQANTVQGLFLSSGVAGGSVRTQDKLLETAEVLRVKMGYQGYLHLKIMPGAEFDQVRRAMQLADRVSLNLEAPTTDRLGCIAPEKVMINELLTPLRWIETIRQEQPESLGWKGHWPSSTTQFVVGSAGENDYELLRSSEYLFSKLRLTRVYYSKFRPVDGTPLENLPSTNPWRQNRLYQASYLLRDYGFSYKDLIFDGKRDLPLDTDPKLAWARVHLAPDPLEINLADYHDLLRVPGIGLNTAKQILSERKGNPFYRLDDLRRLGINARRAAPFILLDGRQEPQQMRLW
jgi:predicted DNA-binding helix-hairpin-helix protein